MMNAFYDPGDPRTTAEIVSSILSVEQKASAMFSGMTPREFFLRPAKGWSPAQNVVHLIKTTWPVTLALGLPRPLLRLLFGNNPREPRSFVAMRAAYYASLTTGRAGVLAPLRIQEPREAEEKQRRTLARLKATKLSLIKTFQSIPEEYLDLVQLPHPSIGKVSMREMVLTTINHDLHHLNAVHKRRMGSSTD